MRANVIVGVILHCIESWDADCNKAQVVRVTDWLNDVFASRDIVKLIEPCVEDRPYRFIVFEIPTVDWPGAGIEIEVNIELFSHRFFRVTRQVTCDKGLRAK